MNLNLHSPLEGRLRPSTAAELALEAGVAPPPAGWEQALQLDGPANLTVYLAKVAAPSPFFRCPRHIARITCGAVEGAAADGADYLELRFGPATHVHMGFDMNSVMAAVCDGLAEGARRSGIHAGVRIQALRHHAEEPTMQVEPAATRFEGRGVVRF